MKKTALTILMTVAVSAASFGQTAYDAQLFSENDYEGTARSVAMGNAFTALGGDLGAVGINPAGSAVAGYSQFTLTPSITFSTSTAAGVEPPGSSSLPYFEKSYKNTIVRAGIPNIGFSFNFDTGRKSGFKSLTVSFVMNRSNTWCDDIYAKGTNYTTSFAAAAAAATTRNIADYNKPDVLPPGEPRYSVEDLKADDAYDYYSPWKDIVSYRSGIISPFSADGEKFIGATEILFDNGDIQQGGPLYQTYGRSVHGNKYEYIFNVGVNISDFVYLGANLGINSISYDYMEYFKEAAVDTDDFENVFTDNDGVNQKTYFRDMMYRYNYSANGSGVFGKFGIIVTPGGGLRIGAAIQTPTSTTIREQWQETGETKFTNTQFNGYAQSPLGENTYRFRSPFRANFGIAYTIGQIGLVSADYELADYKGMKYMIDRYDMTDEDISYYEEINANIRRTYGISHHLRVGAEFKPMSILAVRAGYNLSTSPEIYDLDGNRLDDIFRHNISFGLGYNSKKSFFADMACRYTFANKEYYMPYEDYQFNDMDEIINYSPEILIKTSNWKVLLTIGWRF